MNYGSQIDLTPTASKSGYTFVGWNTSKTATTKLTSLTMGTSNVTLYAIYSKTVTATCYYYSGSAQTSKKVSGTMYNKATTVSVNLGTSSVSGYTFRGWSTTNSGSATIAVASNGSVSLSANATYYGLYQYTVTGTYYYYNGSSYTNTKVNATAYMNSSGTKVGGKPTAPTVKNPSGWTARGWSTSSSASATVAIPGAITGPATYYYSWQKTITLTYNANGGSSAPASQSATRYLNYAGTQSRGSLTITSSKPVRDTYVFNGWNTNSSGTGTNYSAGTTVTSSLTLYAKWTEAVAKIGTVYYTKLATAINAVANNSSTTITMVRNTTESVTFPAGKIITLALNNKTITGNQTNNGTLTLTNTGTITSSNGTTFLNNGTLTINSVTILRDSGTSSNLEPEGLNNKGLATMNSGIVKVREAFCRGVNNYGTFNFKGGTIESEVNDDEIKNAGGTTLYNSAGTTTMTGGTVIADNYGVVVNNGSFYGTNGKIIGNGYMISLLVENNAKAECNSMIITSSSLGQSTAVYNNTNRADNIIIRSRATNYGITGIIFRPVVLTTNTGPGQSSETVTIYNLDSVNAYFPVWTKLNDQDDLIWMRGTVSGATHSVTIYKSQHNNETGIYNVHIYKADSNFVASGDTVAEIELTF